MESGPESARSTASENRLVIKKQAESDTIAAIAGNPNVGKSTVFNALTGMRQHTGNWPGKTVAIAQGHCRIDGNGFVLVDIPGTYSLSPHSAEEEVARDFICLSSHDAVVVVCDACCLERNLILALQAMETGCKMLLCVNMMDEARRKGIEIDLGLLSERLGVPVVGISARKRKTLSALKEALSGLCEAPAGKMYKIRYTGPLERAVESLQSVVERAAGDRFDCRWLSLRLLEDDETLLCGLERSLGFDITRLGEIRAAVGRAKEQLCEDGFDQKKICDNIASCAVLCAEEICTDAVRYDRLAYHASDR